MRLRSKKQELSNDVIRIIHSLCKVVFNISSAQQIERMFGISQEQMEGVIKKIIQGLPERIFEPEYNHKLEEVKTICAREYIFFQVREGFDDPNYQEDLARFIKVFAKDIDKKI